MNLWAARRYVPRRYPGRMTVLLSGDTPPGFTPDPARDLDGLRAAEVDLVSVPGVSDTMMKEPHVSVLAARLKTRLG